MKTAMKRLLSFVLVAMMLVSVLPFQASAAEVATAWRSTGLTENQTYMQGLLYCVGQNEALRAAWEAGGDIRAFKGEITTAAGFEGLTQITFDEDDVVGAENAGKYTFAVFEEVKETWTVTVTGDVTGTITMDVDPKTDGSDFGTKLGELLGTNADAYDVGEVTAVTGSTNAYTCNVKLKEYEVQIVVDGIPGPSYDVKHGSSIVLDNAKILATTTYNNMEVKPGQWVVTDSAGATVATVNNGGSVTVTDNLTATMELVSTGYRSIELLNADGTRFGWAYMDEATKKIIECDKPHNYDNQKFVEWVPKNIKGGTSIYEGKDMTGYDVDTQYIAKWETTVNNGRSTLKVVAVYYADDHEKDRATVFTQELDNTDTGILTGVLGVAYNQIKAEIEAQAPDYFGEAIWDGNYYNSSFSTKYTDTSLTMNGDKTVYVKLNAKDEYKAKVLLYVHKKVASTPDQILEMKGYLPYDDITLNDAITVAKAADWRASSYKMYTDREWTQLLKVTNATVYTTEEIVAGEGTTVVHLLLTNGYKTGGTADTSNPKTGDTILMAGGVLGLSAAALAVLYFLNKKKQVI